MDTMEYSVVNVTAPCAETCAQEENMPPSEVEHVVRERNATSLILDLIPLGLSRFKEIKVCTRQPKGTLVELSPILPVYPPTLEGYVLTPAVTPMGGEIVRVTFQGDTSRMTFDDQVFLANNTLCTVPITPYSGAKGVLGSFHVVMPQLVTAFVCYVHSDGTVTHLEAPLKILLPLPTYFATEPIIPREAQYTSITFPQFRNNPDSGMALGDTAFVVREHSLCDSTSYPCYTCLKELTNMSTGIIMEVLLPMGRYKICYQRRLGAPREVSMLRIFPPNPSHVSNCHRLYNKVDSNLVIRGTELSNKDTVVILQSPLRISREACYADNHTALPSFVFSKTPNVVDSSQVTVPFSVGNQYPSSFVMLCYKTFGGNWSPIVGGNMTVSILGLRTVPAILRRGVIRGQLLFSSPIPSSGLTKIVQVGKGCGNFTPPIATTTVQGATFTPAATDPDKVAVCVQLPDCGEVYVGEVDIDARNPVGYTVSPSIPTTGVLINVTFVGTDLRIEDSVVFSRKSCNDLPLEPAPDVVVGFRNATMTQVEFGNVALYYVCYTHKGGLSELPPITVGRSTWFDYYKMVPEVAHAGNRVLFRVFFSYHISGGVSMRLVPSNESCTSHSVNTVPLVVHVLGDVVEGSFDYLKSTGRYSLCYLNQSYHLSSATQSYFYARIPPEFEVESPDPSLFTTCPLQPRVGESVRVTFIGQQLPVGVDAAKVIAYQSNVTCFKSPAMTGMRETSVQLVPLNPKLALWSVQNNADPHGFVSFPTAGQYLVCYTRQGSVSSPVGGAVEQSLLRIVSSHPSSVATVSQGPVPCVLPFLPLQLRIKSAADSFLTPTDTAYLVDPRVSCTEVLRPPPNLLVQTLSLVFPTSSPDRLATASVLIPTTGIFTLC